MTMKSDDSERRRIVSSLADGATVHQYKIIHSLGTGGMGEVYLALDTTLGREIALKFISPNLAADTHLRDRFMREARAAAALNHPNIITIYEVGEYQTRPFIAMEFVPGQTLKDLITNSGLSVDQALDIAIEIASALQKAHNEGIIHRDIKPQNILVDSDGRVKILDFGLAKFHGAEELTGSHSTLGTVAYMSPEQINGEPIDARSDLFSFGAVLYELLAGKPPFEGEYEAAILYAVVHKQPPPLSTHREGVPPEVEKIVSTAMVKDHEARYQSIDAMLADLTALRDGGLTETGEAADMPSKLLTSIAVIPFTDLSPEKDQEYFCDGIAEELINGLSQIEGLQVVARTSSFQFRHQEIDIHEIGQVLNVATIMEGSVRKAGGRFRITVQLIKVSDGYHLWSDKFDGELEDVFAVQDRISTAVVDALKVRLLGKSGKPLIRRSTENIEAFNCYIKGRYFWNKRYEGGLQTSIQYFKEAIDRDPAYAAAYAGLADAFNVCGYYNFLEPHDACPKAAASAQKALEIDSELAEAHIALGWVKTFYAWDWDTAESAFKRALELNPDYALTHHYYALHLLARRRFDDALSHMLQAQRLDPLSLIINTCVGVAYYFRRDHDAAIRHYQKTLEMDPNFVLAHAFYAGPLVARSMLKEATVECQKAGALAGGSTYATAFLAYVHAVSGRHEEAVTLLDKLLELSKETFVSSSYIAMVYLGLRDFDEGFKLLDRACEEHDNWLVWLDVYPVFDVVRDDPRFARLRSVVGLDR